MRKCAWLVNATFLVIILTDVNMQVPAEIMSILSDSNLFSNTIDITTKEILKRIEGRAPNGGTKQYDGAEFASRQESHRRAMATRVDTDPALLQEPTIPFTTTQGTPPPQWRHPDSSDIPHPEQYERSGTPQADNGQRKEWRNSAWGKPNNSLATGTG